MSNIDKIKAEIETRRQNMVNELMGHEENCEYHRLKGMHDAYVDLLTYLTYHLPEDNPSEDLEQAAEEWYDKCPFPKSTMWDEGEVAKLADSKETFIAGAEWQKEQTEERWLKDRDGCFWDGVEEGKKAMKEQMMKDAVEGFVYQSADYYPKELIARYEGDLKMGDKVKIIIVKED